MAGISDKAIKERENRILIIGWYIIYDICHV